MEELRAKLLDIEPASFVELKFCVENEMEKTYRGYYKLYRRNKQEWSEGDYVRLIDTIDVTENLNRKLVKPLFVNIPDILKVKVISETDTNEPRQEKEDEKKVEIPEFILPTMVINKRGHLEKMLDALKGVQVIACSFEGDVSRLGKCSWVNLVVDNTIVALQIQPLTMEMGEDSKLWGKLESEIFDNRKIVKIIHDCRSVADFLYHQHSIRIENVFDTMIADIYLEKTKNSKIPQRFSSLSECLKRHCNNIASPVEMQILQEYENYPYAQTSSYWLSATPPPNILKIGAIKIKYLIFLRQVLLQKIMSKYTTAVQLHIDNFCKTTSD